MAQNAEANILITIKEKGKEAFESIKSSMASIVKIAGTMIAALVSVGAAIGKLAKDASEFEEIKLGFDRLAASQGANADKIVEKMKQASDGVLSTAEIMKAANAAMLAGIPIDRLQKITEIAKGAANAQGDSVSNMMSVMTNGLARTSTMMLRHVGIVFDEIEAYKSYAKSIGKTSEELTDSEKKQAFLNKALQVGQQTLDKLGPSQISVSDQWERLKATQADNVIVIGQKLIPAFRVMLNLLDDTNIVLKEMNKGSGVFESLTLAASQTFYAFQILGHSIQSIFDHVIGLGTAIKVAMTKGLHAAEIVSNDVSRKIQARREFIERQGQERISTIINESETRREKTQKEKDEENAKKEIELAKTREENKTREIINVRKEWEDKYVQSDFQTFQEQLEIKKNMEASVLQERIRQRQLAEEQEKARMQNFVSMVQTATSTGLQGLSSKTLNYLTNEFIPGAGGAVTAVFDVLSQSTDQFKETLNKLFGPEFIDNVLNNLVTLIESLPGILDKIINYLAENMPAITERLIESIIASLPEISASFLRAFTKMLGNPKFIADLGAAIAKGFVAGIRGAIGDITEALKKAFRDAAREVSGVNFLQKGAGFVEKAVSGFNSVLPGGGFGLIGFEEYHRQALNPDEFARLVAETEEVKATAEYSKYGVPYLLDSIKKTINSISGSDSEGSNNLFGNFLSSLKNYPQLEGLIPGYASGGLIDNRLIRATNGEFVTNKDSTSANMGLLNMINNSNGRSVGMGNNIVINVNGGLMGDRQSAQQFAKAIDEELYRLRQGNASRAFDRSLY